MASVQKSAPGKETTAHNSSIARLAAAAESRADAFHADGNCSAALQAAIQAAELYIRAGRETSQQSDKQLLDRKCSAVLAKAEGWKKVIAGEKSKGEELQPKVGLAASPSQPPSRPPRKRPTPKVTRALSVKEQTVLLKSSKINGGVFPPWKGPPAPAEFAGAPFQDPAGMLQLSDLQKTILDDWKRPHEICENARILPGEDEIVDLTQDVITDCSVVASLCSGVRREEKGFGQTIINILYPQDDKGRPVVSPSGKYIVKLFFNGCYRKVIIDDYLPVSKSDRSLYVTCRRNPTVFAAALIEKAYLKIMGGYDFPGSNSGTDLLALTGWIPEHVFLQSDEVVLSALWRRMVGAWTTGDVLITLGTGRLTTREETELGLIGEHDYAVLDMKEEDGDRFMLVKNPWSEGTVWRGAPTDDDDEKDEPYDFDAPSPCSSEDGLDMKDVKDALPSREPLQPGVFWISLENVFRNFASLYLNWNPTLFTRLYESHFSWDLSTKVSETSFGQNPQFSISNPSSTAGPVWIILSRHLGLSNTADEGVINNGFISLYLFDAAGRRVYLSSPSIHRTPYVDSPQTLLSLDNFPAGENYTLAVSSQDLSPTTHSFSLMIYSLSTLTINPVAETYPYSLVLSSAWTDSTAGGNAHSPEYPKNPQFVITLPTQAASLALLLETPSPHPVHVKLVYSKGERVAAVTTREIVAESGEYKRSTALATTSDLPPGKYTVVASTFESGQLGAFKITLLTTASTATFSELPSETAGCFETVVKGVWPPGRTKLVWPMDVGRFMGLWVKARSVAAIKLTVFGAIRQPHEVEADALVAQSGGGAFVDLPMGVRTTKTHLEWIDGGYIIVLERLGSKGGEPWEITVVSEGTLWVGEEMDLDDDDIEEE
ncbi:hypothetical protein BZA05DRAFT_162398 [Tricharina praecox]|uniref:uncharacterized protein n=1 Tax=Tricharina praecox TaxID=43433 RepID=UPI00221E7E20|nr:uncharacterized protein BZA05DRAFT_162398 [Tricharina praecox]KAI5856944.1 hypothetical protein BZA05DRAFT_162398 [Tricharina praecox]